MKYLDAVPEAVRKLHAEFEDDGWLFEDADAIRHAAVALITDPSMGPCWETLTKGCDPAYKDDVGYDWAESFWVHAIYAFDSALSPRTPWQQMTLREQDQWLADFEEAIDRVKSLLERAPLPEGETGIATFTSDTTEFDRRMMQARADHDDGEGGALVWLFNHFRAGELADMAEPPAYRFSGTLDRYVREQLRAAQVERQVMKKPRDLKAPRARFLQAMTSWCSDVCGSPMREVVATTAALVFQDEAITPRLVRTHTSRLERTDSSEKQKNPASSKPQDSS
ncbi:hypothetical protein [Novilysobacter erysipheiresistens]|uniref:Uncharacterized protein n=1 Tax=Novilysobacter erysipheiresistens TaxID=1749332 RepID=A0ABU7YW99_9GAMM